MLIKVTQEHIDNGVQHKSKFCPIALAIKDTVQNNFGVSVGPEKAYIFNSSNGDIRIDMYELPEIARDFVSSFDRKESVEPIQFQLFASLTSGEILNEN